MGKELKYIFMLIEKDTWRRKVLFQASHYEVISF